jgi:hypothetical protein
MGGNKLTLKRFWIYIVNPIYAGVIYEKWTEDHPVKAQFEGLVSFEMFNAANRGKRTLSEDNGVVTIADREAPEYQLRKGSRTSEYPYRKYVTCSTCARPLFGSAAKGRYKSYPGYHCNKRGHHFRVPKAKLEATVESFVERVTFTDDHIEDIMRVLETVWQKRHKDDGKDEAALTSRLTALRAQVLATVDKIKLLSSQTAIKYMEEDIVELEQQIEEIETQIEVKKAEQPISFDVVLKYAKYFLQHIDSLILQQSDSVKKADFFSVIFDKTPTYAEIASVTNEEEQNAWSLTGLNELFRIKKDPSIFDESLLVRVRGL